MKIHIQNIFIDLSGIIASTNGFSFTSWPGIIITGGCIHPINNGSTSATALTIPEDTTSQHDTHPITDTASADIINYRNNRTSGNGIMTATKLIDLDQSATIDHIIITMLTRLLRQQH